jgi:hypothetical protein
MIGPFEKLAFRAEQLELSVFGKNSKTNKLDILTEKVTTFDREAKEMQLEKLALIEDMNIKQEKI